MLKDADTSKEIAELKTYRMLIQGALAEQPIETQQAVAKIREEIKAVSQMFGPPSIPISEERIAAVMLASFDLSIAALERT